MFDIPLVMDGFHKELTKEALVPASLLALGRKVVRSGAFSRGVHGAGAGAGLGAAGGAAGGAAIGAGKGYQQAREAGAEPGAAAGRGLLGSLGGAAKGALLGAGVGTLGLGGAAAALRRYRVGALPAMGGPIGAISRFGQRQVHGLTGWKPSGGLQSIRGGAWAAEEALKKAPHSGPAFAHARAARAAEKAGLTSLPGYAKGLATKPLQTLRTGTTEQWHAMGPFGRALIYGYPAVAGGGALLRKGEPGEGGRLERAGRHLGAAAYGLGPLPILPQLALAEGLSVGAARAGRAVGRKLDKRKKRVYGDLEAPPSIEPAGGMTQPEEYVYSGRGTGAQ